VIIGVVGSEAAKFTPETQAEARRVIRQLIAGASLVVSGHSPLGGIDWWAIEEAKQLDIPTLEFPPIPVRGRMSWLLSFKPRNLRIATASDMVICITVKQLPVGYTGRRFGSCYHCQRYAPHFGGSATIEHVKSGGCWTMWQAAHMGKQTQLEVI